MMKTILLCTAALFALCSAVPFEFYEKVASARNQRANNLCVSLSYTPSPPAFPVTHGLHVCNTAGEYGEGTCILSFIPRCTPTTLHNWTAINATLGGVTHEVRFSTTTCYPGVCFYSIIRDCPCNRCHCPCKEHPSPTSTTPLPTTTTLAPSTTLPTTTLHLPTTTKVAPRTSLPSTTLPLPTTTRLAPSMTLPTTTLHLPTTTTLAPSTTLPTTTLHLPTTTKVAPSTSLPSTTLPLPTTTTLAPSTSLPTTTLPGQNYPSPLPTPLPTISPTPTPLHCRMSLDMYFILDSTRSLKESGFQLLKEFIVSFVDMFDIGSPGNIQRQGVTRVGVIEFWGTGFFPTGKYAYKRNSKVVVPLGDYKDKAELDNKINALKFKDGTITYIEAGLQKLLQDKQFGKNITGRQRVAILLSDGDEDTSINGPESRVWMLGNASAIRGCGIQLYAVGSGKENLTNLDAITSDEANVFTTSSYKNSQGIRVKLFNRLLEQFCPNEPPLPTPSSVKVAEGCFCSVTNGIEECYPPGCDSLKESKKDKGDSLKESKKDKEALEQDILRAIEEILVKKLA